MSPDLVFVTAYECPRCHFALEADPESPPTWLRCPHCGRASLPPEVVRRPSGAEALDRSPLIATEADPLLDPGDPLRPRAMAALPPQAAPASSTLRLILGSGFFLTILFCVFSLLGGEWAWGAGCGIASAAFLFLLSRPGRPADGE